MKKVKKISVLTQKLCAKQFIKNDGPPSIILSALQVNNEKVTLIFHIQRKAKQPTVQGGGG